jgi:nucleoside-diphosphate-sugar epimerase
MRWPFGGSGLCGDDPNNFWKMPTTEIASTLVTGAQQGIGAAVAAALGAQGMTVLVNCRDDEPAAADVVAAIEAAGG